VLATLAGPAAAQQFDVIDLGTLGGSISKAYGVNSSGVIVGMANGQAVRWTDLVIANLGTLGGPLAEAYGVNSQGVAVGFAEDAGSLPRAFRRNGSTMEDLGTLGGTIGYAYAINDSGDVAGYSTLADDTPHAFLRHAGGGMDDLGTLGGTKSYAFAICDSGWVAGQSYTAAGSVHAFMKPPGFGLVDLGTLGGANSYAYGIRRGQGIVVVGSSLTTGNLTQPVCAWTWQRKLRNLGTLGGNFGAAYAINRGQEVVGASMTASSQLHAFYWFRTGPLYDLNNGIPADSGWTLVEARGISNNGFIVGWGYHNGLTRAFLLRPAAGTGVGGASRSAVAFTGPSPNPMSRNTNLSFELASGGAVRLDLFDVQGRQVRTLSGMFGVGAHQLQWDGRDGAGRPVGSGFYWARLRAGGQDLTRRVTVVR
jgi:probable HAF family extracellular repeat protein